MIEAFNCKIQLLYITVSGQVGKWGSGRALRPLTAHPHPQYEIFNGVVRYGFVFFRNNPLVRGE